MTAPNQQPIPPPGDDAWLDKMLRENQSTYIDDSGFTARVAASLPPPGARAERRRNLLIVAGTFAGCAVAWALGGTDLTPLFVSAVDAATTLASGISRDSQTAFTVIACASFVVAAATGWWALARSK